MATSYHTPEDIYRARMLTGSDAVEGCGCPDCSKIRWMRSSAYSSDMRSYNELRGYGGASGGAATTEGHGSCAVDFGQSTYTEVRDFQTGEYKRVSPGDVSPNYMNVYPGEISPSYQDQGVRVDRHGEILDDFLNTPYGRFERVKPKPKEKDKESWCRCGGMIIDDELSPAFMDGLVGFKKQWFVSQNLLTQEDIDSIEEEHEKKCSANHFHNWYAKLNDIPLY